ncbi:fumarylacetoacetate hydrolase family protein [Sphingomonas tabacisoli]|uniref:Fumarylacetoacetate hydrolase family protein n=1 Tax=Sphingomonas tabacisoli TaxID=2249466 RepID=A0ABW4I2J4_9SPHN
MEAPDGPTPILVHRGRVLDVSTFAPTCADFVRHWRGDVPQGRDLGPIDELPWAPSWEDGATTSLLAPIDLQCIKASGVTFAVSAVERVIEERARGDARKAEEIRDALRERVGADIRSVKPGSEAAARLKEALIADGLWSQYLEVAIGPHAEIFTKAQPLSAVGWGAWIGVRGDSHWNNPEPEIVLAVAPDGRAVGATLGNDVNLRDFEGRSALLLGEAKDNNASCALGPFIRLFDDRFTLDDVRNAVVRLEIAGDDQFRLSGESSMNQISRDPEELVAQALSHHRYPDGFVLFLGTMFAPTQDRDQPGLGFTHKRGDVVRVFTPRLGVLENKVTPAEEAPAWTFGLSDLMRNLAGRGLLA